jgi:hypothetical protein
LSTHILRRAQIFRVASAQVLSASLALDHDAGGSGGILVFRNIHELLTAIVTKSLGKIMVQRPPGEDLQKMEDRFQKVTLLNNGVQLWQSGEFSEFLYQLFLLFAFGQQQSCLPMALESFFDQTSPPDNWGIKYMIYFFLLYDTM